MEWEFVAGGIESPHVRKLLKDWTADEKALPTLAICGNSAPENVAAALYLPQPLYDRQVPIFVYQKETATILEIARRSSRYRSVYPFGMMCESYDATLKQRIRKAKRINYVYNHFTDAKKAAKKAADELNEKFDFKTFAAGFEIADWPDDKIDKYWNDQSLAFQWSNIYAANAIPAKLRSLGIDPRQTPLAGYRSLPSASAGRAGGGDGGPCGTQPLERGAAADGLPSGHHSRTGAGERRRRI